MKIITKLFTLIAALFVAQTVNAQCPAGQLDVEMDFTTDAWGYEVYWEVVPLGGTCGTGTVASGGNAAVGCAGAGLQTITAGGYGNSTTVNESIGCLTEGGQYDLIMVDDWGDGLTVVDLVIGGVPVSSFAPTLGDETFTFTVSIPENNLVMDSIFYNGASDITEQDVYFFQIPLKHAKLDTMYFGAGFTNRGTNDQANTTFSVDVSGAFPYSENINIGTLNAGASFIIDSLFVSYSGMKQMGSYDFDFTVQSDSTDELPIDNVWMHSIEVTDTVYARDNNNLDAGWASQANPSSNQVDALACSYYINADDIASSISVRLYDFSQVDGDIGAIIQLIVYDGNFDPVYKSDYHIVDASDVTTGMLTLPLILDANDVPLTGDAAIPAGFYNAGISILSGVAMVGIDPEQTAAAQTVYTRNNGTWFYTTGSIYQIRLNVKTDPCNILTLNSTVNDISCSGNNDGEIDLIPLNGTAPYTYSWDNSETTSSISNLSVGSYIVAVTDDNGCIVEGLYIVNEPTALSTTVTANDASCGLNNGDASASVSGGTAPYNYFWNNTINTSSISNLVAGTYGITITDDNGCTASASDVVSTTTSTVTLSISVTSNDACGYDMGSALATASSTGGAVSFMWDNGDVTDTIIDLAVGTYTVTATDADGCTSSAMITITEMLPAVTASVSTTDAGCSASDGTATVSMSTTYTYLWDDGSAQTTATATGLDANVYFVMVTDTVTTCVGGWLAYVNNPATSITLATTITNVDCYGNGNGEIIAEVTSTTLTMGYSVWTTSGDSITTIVSAFAETISNLNADEYIVFGFDMNGCATSSIVTITEPAMLMVSTSVTADATCNGDSDGAAMAMAMGGASGFTYMWDNSSTTNTATGLTSGNSNVTVTDANGCMQTASAMIAEPSAIDLNISSGDLSCNGMNDGWIDILTSGGGAGGYTYSWDNGLAAMANQTGLSGNTYNVTVTDANGCTAMGSAVVTDPAALNVTVTATDDFICLGAADGAATATATGGTGSISYFWSNGGTGNTNSTLAAGTHSVMIIDANGCSATSNAVTITEAATAVMAMVTGTNESCFGCSDGTAMVMAMGGTAPYTYAWNVPGNTASLSGLTCPSSTIISNITDSEGCTDSGSYSFICDDIDAIEEVNNLSSMVVYPNPNNGVFNVEVNATETAEYTFIVRNV
ncbi:MAG: SprB repeat-containing protein, partial [Flavobacteriales bacterium]|nr:SprB repeat-containing protein [Flavobacteriales bacterium]